MKRLFETPMDKLNLIDKIGLMGKLDQLITDGFSDREKKLYHDYMIVRLKLANLEDDVLYMYSPDWFRCESCNTVTHGDHLSAHYCNTDTKICALCAPENE